MNFKAQIYIPNSNLSFFKKWTISEKLMYTGLFFSFLLIMTLYGFHEICEIEIPKKFSVPPLVLSMLLIVFGAFYRMIEFENLNGEINGEVSFKNGKIIINEDSYDLKTLKNFEFNFNRIYEDQTNNTKSGPCISLGVKNNFSFDYNNSNIVVYFQLKNKLQYDTLNEDLYYYLINDFLVFSPNKLQYIDEKYLLNPNFVVFMKKIIEKNNYQIDYLISNLKFKSSNQKEIFKKLIS
jgi:hypothetical protein